MAVRARLNSYRVCFFSLRFRYSHIPWSGWWGLWNGRHHVWIHQMAHLTSGGPWSCCGQGINTWHTGIVWLRLHLVIHTRVEEINSWVQKISNIRESWWRNFSRHLWKNSTDRRVRWKNGTKKFPQTPALFKTKFFVLGKCLQHMKEAGTTLREPITSFTPSSAVCLNET